MQILNNLLNLFFPDLCLSCKNRLAGGEQYICIACFERLPRTNYHNVKDNKLEQLFAGRFPFQRVSAFAHFVKGGSLQGVIHDLKYNNNPKLGIYLGKLCAKEVRDSSFIADIDYLIPIPLHPKRQKQRGYNQALMIAEGISDENKIPVLSHVLKRIVNNKSQTQKSRFERWSNTADIFGVQCPEVLKDKHILLVDDVITTGSTIESCAKTILNNCDNTTISILSVGVAID